MVQVYLLIEQAIGYGLLKVEKCKSTDELLTILAERNMSKLQSTIKLVEFQPFASADNAAHNCVDIANGIVSDDLKVLLKAHLSEGKCILVVNDKKLLESLKEAKINADLTFSADNNLIFNMREIRHNFHLFLNDKEDHLVKAHIGLGHGYSRIKIAFNVNRSDNMIIQTINLLDQMDKDINTIAMRLREWFGYHYPELFKIVPEYKMYAKVIQFIRSRAGAVESNLEKLEEILQDSNKAQMIVESAKTSMGYELTDEDFLNISMFADKIVLMIEQREYTIKYLNTKMGQVAPNFSTLVGDIVAARLISHAGSLINLAKFPASTIQILGAEKALFRAIKTRGNTPKYGLIFHSSFIGRAAKGDKGRISRFLAAKISLAVRLDCFSDDPINIYGQHLKKHVEDQLVYLETGKEPQKNYEMMEAAVKDAKSYVIQMKADAVKKEAELAARPIKSETEAVNGGKPIKTEKLKKKRKTEEVDTKDEPTVGEPEKKKKKKKTTEEEVKVEETKVEVVAETDGKKKKKSKPENGEVQVEAKEEPAVESTEKKKKKKKRAAEEEMTNEVVPEVKIETAPEEKPESDKKKKKSKKVATEEEIKVETPVQSESPKKKKKSKKTN